MSLVRRIRRKPRQDAVSREMALSIFTRDLERIETPDGMLPPAEDTGPEPPPDLPLALRGAFGMNDDTLGTQEDWLKRQTKSRGWTLPQSQYAITVIISVQLSVITILLGVIVGRLP